ncbi:MAG TPA: CPBP family intramembrane glutamic endopeptidase [bacterium]
MMTFIVSFFPFFREAGIGIILLAFLFALVNGAAEELLWRGALVAAYSSGFWRGYLYPTFFFGAWHIAPELVLPNPLSGGALSFIGGALVMGLAWGWIAWHSRSILLTSISHVLTNFFGFVGFIFMNWMR